MRPRAYRGGEMIGIDKDLAKLAQMGSAEDLRMLAARETLRLADLVRHARSSSDENGPIVDILLERADRILAKDGGRNCKRVLTDAEIDCCLRAMSPKMRHNVDGPDLAQTVVLSVSDQHRRSRLGVALR